MSNEAVEKRAYEIYLKRQRSTSEQDWEQALDEIESETKGECPCCHQKHQKRVKVDNGETNKEPLIDAIKLKVIYWQKNWKIPQTSWSICGYSRSAYRTGFYIPELNLMLDAGPQNFNKPDFILITHTHIDHIACLPFTLIGDATNVQLYGPVKAEEKVVNYINAMFSVNAMATLHTENSVFKYNGMNANSFFSICANKSNMEIEVFKCDHAIPTISYGLSEIKIKLKDEFRGKDIAYLKKQGFEVTHEISYKKLAYVCDTSIKVFDLNPTILDYPVIFIECTFLYDDELQNAIDTRHIHWKQLRPIIVANPNTKFMLFHFSQRYRDVEINEFFSQESESLTNFLWW